MKFIGITGGIGAGKSEVLAYLRQKQGIRVMLADEIAHEQMKPGTQCHEAICQAFAGEAVIGADGLLDRNRMATLIFRDDKKRELLNSIVHPAVKAYVLMQWEKEMEKGKTDLLVLEAALLLEEHYDEICDELWCIYASKEERRKRLKASRGYSDEKIDRIFQTQKQEEEYRKACRVWIDNNGSMAETIRQVETALKNIRPVETA